jgi:hypothetical protein
LGGIIELGWADEIQVESSNTETRLSALVSNAAWRPRDADAGAMLDLLALPGWRFMRAPGLGNLDVAIDKLIGHLG